MTDFSFPEEIEEPPRLQPQSPTIADVPVEITTPRYHPLRKDFAFRENTERVTLPRRTVTVNPLDLPGPESRI